jgi:hypothetical protein
VYERDFSRLCPECKLEKQPRSKHCKVCNHCVERFDHHCEWLGICIGKGNYPTYLVFISSVFLSLMITFYICIRELAFELGPDQYSFVFGSASFLPDFFYKQSVSLVLIGLLLIA